ncbi:MAG: Asp-tRNA(Asn)/Glu-tRNA(Gln) amidotransferase subunit GatC [Simkaniaceae bacterium]
MEKIDIEDLKKLAALSKLLMTDEELQGMIDHLKTVTDHANSLTQIDTENIEPCHIVYSDKELSLREDVVKETLDPKSFLASSPSTIGAFIRVPPIMQES